MNRNLALVFAALALAACSPDFDPASKVEKLRVLAIKAQPPEIVPPSADAAALPTAALTSLVLHAPPPPGAAPPTAVGHAARLPGPGATAPRRR